MSAAAAVGVAPNLTQAAERPLGPSLAALARGKGVRFGGAVGGASFADPRYRQVLIDECGVLVPENELKWYVLRPNARTFAFERADRIAAFAKAHDIDLRGHTLLWHHPKWFPAWLKAYDFGKGPAAARNARALLVDHIDKVVAHYPQIDSWDVVNETIDPKDGSIRRTVFSDAMGPEQTLDAAFHAARAAAPKARLVYNDYMGWEAGNEAHRAGVLKLLEGFRKRGTPVDALGVQSHLGTEDPAGGALGPPQEKAWRAFIDEATGMGYDLLITEFDVNDQALPADVAIRDAETAAIAKAYLDLMLDYRQTREVLAWGMVDKYSWLQGFTPRKDRLAKRVTLYDDAYRPKPLREAMAAAFRSAPARA
ncbi:MAG TPA: endo-1,4-beta-xylanase [Caulobacter sp.]|nr:endo-1,4-beta-xylanase [Caulobacter sp.]